MFSALFTLFPYSVTKTVTEDNPFLHSVDICPGPIRGLWAAQKEQRWARSVPPFVQFIGVFGIMDK